MESWRNRNPLDPESLRSVTVKDKQFEEVERLAFQVEGQEQRAYLHLEIAKGLLNTNEMQTHAREVLDEAITEAKRTGATIFAARTQLTASNLYVKIDPGRAISIDRRCQLR